VDSCTVCLFYLTCSKKEREKELRIRERMKKEKSTHKRAILIVERGGGKKERWACMHVWFN
jgi:hypothetical protein